MIICLQGNQGKGKTATLAYLAKHYHKLGFKIHSNFWLEIPGCEPHFITCLADIDKIYQGYFLADEFWTWADSHKSFGDVEETEVNIIMNARKRGYSLIYEAKRAHFVNRRIRELTDYILEPKLYYNNNGSLEIIEQNLLYPTDLTPYLNDMWIIADMFEVCGERMIRMDEEADIIFKLDEVIKLYDTNEEIGSLKDGESHPGIEKGIIKETKLSKYLKTVLAADTEIAHNHNSLGWDIRTPGFAFDCVSTTSRPTSTKPYLDIRGKRIADLLLDARKEKRKPFFVWHYGDQWYGLAMDESHIKRAILSTGQSRPLKEILLG